MPTATETPEIQETTEIQQLFIGIGYGTLNSSISIIGSKSQVEIIANEDGDRSTPSCVVFTAHEMLVGSQAKIQSISNQKSTILEFRNLLGKKFNDHEVQEHSKRLPMTLIESNGMPVYQIQSLNRETGESSVEERSVIQANSLYLAKLKDTSESFLGKRVHGCVISVPPHFEKEQQDDMIKATKEAGFSQVFTIHEPVAAALAFAHSPAAPAINSANDQNIVVLDLGGHQFNVTCLAAHDGLYSILSCVDDYKLGGVHFDELLVNHVKEEFKRKTKIDVADSRKSILKLFRSCEQTKRSLSRQDIAPCSVESLYEGMDYHGTVNRGRFEVLCDPLYNRCVEVVHSALKDAGLTPDNVHQVLLVGGSSRMPRFQTMMKQIFSEKTAFRTDVEPDEAIALGCAIQAGLLNSSNIDYTDVIGNKEFLEAKAVSKSIGIELLDGSMAVLIHKRTPLPCSRQITVKSQEGQDVYVAIYEGDDAIAKNNVLLAEVVLSDLPTGQVTLSLLIEMDGVLCVVAREKTSGTQVKVKIQHH